MNSYNLNDGTQIFSNLTSHLGSILLFPTTWKQVRYHLPVLTNATSDSVTSQLKSLHPYLPTHSLYSHQSNTKSCFLLLCSLLWICYHYLPSSRGKNLSYSLFTNRVYLICHYILSILPAQCFPFCLFPILTTTVHPHNH